MSPVSASSARRKTGLAPAFSLLDQNGQVVALSDFIGKKKLLLVFYPGDFTPGCSLQLSALRDDWTKFKRTDAVILGINHADAASHELFAQRCGLPFQLLVDPGKKISTKYGAIQKIGNTKIIRRTVVILNKQGKIIFFKHGMPKNTDLLKLINAA